MHYDLKSALKSQLKKSITRESLIRMRALNMSSYILEEIWLTQYWNTLYLYYRWFGGDHYEPCEGISVSLSEVYR